MTPEEFAAYDYLAGLDGAWASEDDLVLLGIDTADLDTIFAMYPHIQAKYEADIAISHGMRISLTDGSNDIAITDNEWLKPTTSFSLRVFVALDDYIPAATSYLLSKYNGYRFYIDTAGKLNVDIRDGGADVNYIVTDANAFTNASAYWLRADWTYDAGGGDSSIDFKSSTDIVFDSEDVETWDDIETVTNTQHTITHSTNPLYVGGLTSGSTAFGDLYALEVWGEEVRRCQYDLSYNGRVAVGQSVLLDDLNNRLIITGTANYLKRNNMPLKYYTYQADMGATDPV
jgi:hypothetical protein